MPRKKNLRRRSEATPEQREAYILHKDCNVEENHDKKPNGCSYTHCVSVMSDHPLISPEQHCVNARPDCPATGFVGSQTGQQVTDNPYSEVQYRLDNLGTVDRNHDLKCGGLSVQPILYAQDDPWLIMSEQHCVHAREGKKTSDQNLTIPNEKTETEVNKSKNQQKLLTMNITNTVVVTGESYVRTYESNVRSNENNVRFNESNVRFNESNLRTNGSNVRSNDSNAKTNETNVRTESFVRTNESNVRTNERKVRTDENNAITDEMVRTVESNVRANEINVKNDESTVKTSEGEKRTYVRIRGIEKNNMRNNESYLRTERTISTGLRTGESSKRIEERNMRTNEGKINTDMRTDESNVRTNEGIYLATNNKLWINNELQTPIIHDLPTGNKSETNYRLEKDKLTVDIEPVVCTEQAADNNLKSNYQGGNDQPISFTRKKLRPGKMPYIRPRKKATLKAEIYPDSKATIQAEQAADNNLKSNYQGGNDQQISFTRKKLRPGKMPYIRPRKKATLKAEIYPDSKATIKAEQAADNNLKSNYQGGNDQRKKDKGEVEFFPGKPHNTPNFREKFMPRSKPCSEPRSKRTCQTRLSTGSQSYTNLKLITPDSEKEHETSGSSQLPNGSQINGSSITFLQGNFHQGDLRFGENSGRQCVANSLVSILFSRMKNVSTWNKNDLDNVLCIGNELYMFLQRSSTTKERYLLVSELPDILELLNTTFSLDLGDSISGFVNRDVDENTATAHIMRIDAALRTVFSEHKAAFVTFGGATFAVIQNEENYFVFDSHSRSATGMQVPDGSSIVIQYRKLSLVYEHCLNLALSMNTNVNTQFEVTGISIRPVGELNIDTRQQRSEDVEIESDMSCRNVDGLESEFGECRPSENNPPLYDSRTNDIRIKYLQGNFHQGDLRFGENSGRQCVPNSLVSILFSRMKNVSTWNKNDLDTVLCIGNELYMFLQSRSSTKEQYFLVSELPDTIELFDTTFSLDLGDSISGFVNRNAEENTAAEHIMCIDAALQTVFLEHKAAFVTFGGATFSVIQNVESYFVFDSHSRSASGIQFGDGSSIIIQYTNLSQVYEHCLNLAFSMNTNVDTQYEITGITIRPVTEVQCDMDDEQVRNVQSMFDDGSVEICETQHNVMLYCPVTPEVCKNLCDKLGIKYGDGANCGNNVSGVECGEPCRTIPIDADGNCFFRCLSYAISGTESNHRKFRLAVVKHLKEHGERFRPFLSSGFESTEEYITESRIWYVGTWATEVEILAAANLLKTDIITFSGSRWLRYSGSQIDKEASVNDTAIYLNHLDQSHYEVVRCVETVGILRNSCSNENCDKQSKEKVCNRKRSADQFLVGLLNEEKDFKKAKLAKVQKSKKQYLCAKEKRKYMKLKRTLERTVTLNEHSDAKQKKLATARNRYHDVAEYREKKKLESVKKYRENEQHTIALKEYSVKKYAKNQDHKDGVKKYSSTKYAENQEHRRAVKTYSATKYAENLEHREAVKQYSTKKYAENQEHRGALKTYSATKYAENSEHKEASKKKSIKKYAENKEHRESLKSYNKERYSNDPHYRESKKTYDNEKYKNLEDHRTKVKQRNVARRMKNTSNCIRIENVQNDFKKKISEGPDFICAVCHRRLFRKQVLQCKQDVYYNKGDNIASVAELCITETYHHKCTDNCADDCQILKSPKGSLWVCHTCHRKVLTGKMPAEAVANNLDLKHIPNDLQCLNDLEQHLISLHIPFMKMMALPKGGQHGVHGPVVCVPSNIEKSTSILPRCDAEDQMIRVKLKRKLTYKGHYQYKFVSKPHIENALTYLKENNQWYQEVEFNKEWVNPLPVINEEENEDESETYGSSDSENNTDVSEKLDDEEAGNEHGLLMDTCLQPVDIGQEVLDQQFDKITCVAPAEENDPVRVLMDKCNEAKSFPVLFPSGAPTFHDDREQRITLARYFHTRLMNADSRFARNTDYIFYSQYLSELNQVMSNVSIAMRKGLHHSIGKKISSENLTDSETLQQILKSDEGYKFLKPIRGTPPFWQSAQKDLFAMLRQLGIPTWFCSFSSADLRWPEIIEAILREENDPRKVSELDWSEKCSVLRKNPVTVARMFDQRFHSFLKEVIMSPAEPIGKIKDYFYRVEFQQRGSPHTHCLFWVEDAPKIDQNKDDEVTSFIDKYVTCEMPSFEHDKELHNIVNSVQKHSQRHSKSCRKNGTKCRFNFPRPPSEETFISRPKSNDSDDPVDEDGEPLAENLAFLDNVKIMTTDDAKAILIRIWEALEDENNIFESVDLLFNGIAISQELFQKACDTLSKSTNVVLKRQPSDVWVNQYNSDLLRCWDANMDIQYVVDAYSCVVYIISYISKAEREMGLLLNHAQQEARNEGNSDAKFALKKLGAVYLHNREISAQEAVFRVCNLRLKEGSRKVQFIPTVNPVRMSLPLKILKNKQKSGELDEDEMWMTSIVDRYMNRPNEEEFEIICLARFCSEYRILSKSEVSKVSDENRQSPVIKLQNGLGHVQKRSRTEGAVVRYARFSPTKDPEKYHHSMLQLFLPYRCDGHLKPKTFNTYEDFYEIGAVQIGDQPVESVKDIVDRNKTYFEMDADAIEKAEKVLEISGPLENAWAQICPEAESERIECEQERSEVSEDELEGESDKNIPDLMKREKQPCRTELLPNIVSREEAGNILRSLNVEQSDIFYKIREWCLDKKSGKNPEPFQLFVTGGAGTGKSHLIKALCYDATRILSQIQENPDDISVLLVAPTGVAAFNIHASTIHSAFSIGIDAKLPYMPLSEEKINTLRSKLHSVQILIIDEISMVDHKLLTYINFRLRQIKQTIDHSPFGKVSVIAVGDFHQLSPIRSKPLCLEVNEYDLWNDNFCVAVLSQIMRQRDSTFAKLLNRLRTRKISEPLEKDDVNMLKERETGEDDPSALHIYATNAQVDDYNVTCLHSLCSDPISIEAEDSSKNENSGQMEKRQTHHSKVYNTVLPRSLRIAVGARVMLTKNLDTSDGLVNGVFGIVTDISLTVDESIPSEVCILFDNEKVGQKLRNEKGVSSKSSPIEPQQEIVAKNGGTRRQYPLKLAWACTIHKVQGLTVQKAVVSLDKIFAAGQAYVALSRVTSLDGLIIQGFKESAIYCNAKVEEAVSRMPKFITRSQEILNIDSVCTIMMHNVEGLQAHIKDLQHDRRFLEADFICLTETWLCQSQPKPELDGFTFHDKVRYQSYESSDKMLMELQNQSHGGVGIYCNPVIRSEFPDLPVSNLEYLTFTVTDIEVNVTVVYRPKSYKIEVFRKNLLCLVKELDRRSMADIVMGDFNEDVFLSSSIQRLMDSNGFKQMVPEPTTESGTLIDHVYVRGLQNVSVEVVPIYFGYHEAVRIRFG